MYSNVSKPYVSKGLPLGMFIKLCIFFYSATCHTIEKWFHKKIYIWAFIKKIYNFCDDIYSENLSICIVVSVLKI